MTRNAIPNCEQCGTPITRRPDGDKRIRHCSYKCKSAGVRKISPEALREAASTGRPIKEMAAHFQVNHETVKRWLQADGLFADWARLRYKKCSSQKAGKQSKRRDAATSTASVTATSPSSKSAMPTVGGTSYGS